MVSNASVNGHQAAMSDQIVMISDIQQLQKECGQLEQQLRLRAIVAERMVLELQRQIAELEKALANGQ